MKFISDLLHKIPYSVEFRLEYHGSAYLASRGQYPGWWCEFDHVRAWGGTMQEAVENAERQWHASRGESVDA